MNLFLMIATILGGLIFCIDFMGYLADIPLIRQAVGEGIIGTGAVALVLLPFIAVAFLMKDVSA